MHFGKALEKLLIEREMSKSELARNLEPEENKKNAVKKLSEKTTISRQRVKQMCMQPNVQMKTLEKIGKVLKLKPSTLLALAEKESIE